MTGMLARLAPRRPNQGPADLNDEDLPGEYTVLDGDSPFIACAFYTDNYLPQVQALKHSLEAHGLKHFLKRYERPSTWEAATRLKAPFLWDCLVRFPNHHILYLDADSVVRQAPELLETIATDIGACVFNKPIGGKHCLQLSGGTLYIRNTDGGRRFVREWKAAGQRCGSLATDEDMIHMAFSNLDGLTISVLPMGFCKVFDNRGTVEPIIEHFQASRTQVKLSRRLRRLKRAAVVAGGILLAAACAYLVIH